MQNQSIRIRHLRRLRHNLIRIADAWIPGDTPWLMLGYTLAVLACRTSIVSNVVLRLIKVDHGYCPLLFFYDNADHWMVTNWSQADSPAQNCSRSVEIVTGFDTSTEHGLKE